MTAKYLDSSEGGVFCHFESHILQNSASFSPDLFFNPRLKCSCGKRKHSKEIFGEV